MDAAVAFGVQKIEQGDDASHHLAEKGGNGGSLHPPVEAAHQHHVQHHVGKARRHREGKAQMGLFGGDEEALEHILQNKGGQGQHQDAAIPHGIVQHLALRPQQGSSGLYSQKAQSGQQAAHQHRGPDKKAEIAVGLFPVALAQCDTHDGAAAGAKHEACRADQHRHRHDEIDGGKSRFAHKVRDAQAVHDAVDGGEQHGADAGQHEPQKAAVIKVVG